MRISYYRKNRIAKSSYGSVKIATVKKVYLFDLGGYACGVINFDTAGLDIINFYQGNYYFNAMIMMSMLRMLVSPQI